MNWDLLNSRLGSAQVGTISLNTIIILVILGLILFAFFFLLKRYVIPFLNSRKAIRKAQIKSFRFEVILWTVYAVFALYHLLAESIWISGIIIALIVLAGINFWRDLFSGIIFKLDNKFQAGDPVMFEGYTGIIEGIERRFLIVKTEHEELVRIPFRKVSAAVLIRKQAKGKLVSGRFVLPEIGRDDKELEKLKHWIMNCPWIVSAENAQYSVDAEEQASVSFYCVDQASVERAKIFLKRKLKGF